METLKLKESKLGPDDPGTLASRNNLAVAYFAAGRTAEAITMLEGTLKLMESRLGLDHPDTLTGRNNLAVAYNAAGRNNDAITIHEGTLKLMESKLGSGPPRYAHQPQQSGRGIQRRRPHCRGHHDS